MVTCLCHWVTPTPNKLQVLVLQHAQEVHHAKGSARLLGLSLQHSRCVVEAGLSASDLAALLGPPGCSVLMFPAATAVTQATPVNVSEASTTALPTVHQLVLLDGTWRQARQLLRDHPPLHALPRWALPEPPPSRYAIRRAQRPLQQRSTLEAACLALGQLEGRPAHYEPLLAAFSAWVTEVAARSRSGQAD